MSDMIALLDENDPELKPWDERLAELGGGLDDIDEMLMELDASAGAESAPTAETARNQLELFGTLLGSLADVRQDPELPSEHQVEVSGSRFGGSWEEIVRRMRDEIGNPSNSLEEFMHGVARAGFRQTGVRIPTDNAESFIRGSARAGLLRIVK